MSDLTSTGTNLRTRTFGQRQNATVSPHPAAPGAENFRFRSEAKEAAVAHEATASAARFVVRYNWWLTWIAFGIFLAATGYLSTHTQAILGAPPQDGFKTTPLFGGEDYLFVGSAAVMLLISAVWFVKGLLGRAALTMSDEAISGFTLFGTKTIRWEDISQVRVMPHDTYGKEIRVDATRGTPSSSIFLNCIPLYVSLTDTNEADILAAIRQFRPDF